MQSTLSPIERLESALADTSDVYTNSGVDEAAYFDGLRRSIRSCLCEPFAVTATVQEPGFPDLQVGATVTGLCVAHSAAGNWLVYDPERDRFYCFWGTDVNHLGAHGVFGSPLCCWSS